MSPEENQTFKPIPNPYFAGPPIRGQEVFFGREENFEAVSQRLTAERDGIVMLLVGGRRTGKTSIMYQILEGRLGDEFLSIFVDLQSIAPLVGDREVFDRLADLVLEGIKDERLVRDYYDFDAGNPFITFDHLLDDIQQLFPQKRIIFLVDEAEILQTKVANGELSGAVLTYLASILENRKISFCFTGSPGLTDIPGEEWRRLMGKGDYSTISFLSPEDTKRLIQKPVEGYVSYADGVVDTIYNLTYGQPFFTQIICTNVVDYLNGVQRNELQLEDLDEVVRTIIDSPPPQLIYDWDNLSRQEQLTLALLSSASSGPGDGITAEQLVDAIRENDYPLTLRDDAIHIALESLFDSQWVERDDAGAYYVRVDLFRQWIRRARSVWRLVEDQEPPGKKKTWIAVSAVAAALVVAVTAALWTRQKTEVEEPPPPNAVALRLPTTGDIVVSSTPPGMVVLVNEQPYKDVTPVVIEDRDPGSYTIEIRHEKYRSWKQEVSLEAGANERLTAPLVRKTGTLSVYSQPPQARVSVIGERETTAVTPAENVELPTGDYSVTVRLEGYVETEREVAIRDAEESVLNIDLVARVGGLTVRSDPPGAQIFLDGGNSQVNTPHQFDSLSEGRHRLTLILPDYRDIDTTLTIAIGRTNAVAFELILLPVGIELISEPAGAQVYVDEETNPRTQTPASLVLEPGPHKLRIEHEGYDPHFIERKFAPGEQFRDEHIALRQQYGWVRIIKPIWQTVVIDGKQEEPTPGKYKLPVGWHTLTLKEKETGKKIYIYKDSTSAISLEEDEN